VPEAVWVALVTGAFGVLVAMIHAGRRENRRDHGNVDRALGRIEGKLDAHIGDHRAHE
jgi:hypothetical protein